MLAFFVDSIDFAAYNNSEKVFATRQAAQVLSPREGGRPMTKYDFFALIFIFALCVIALKA